MAQPTSYNPASDFSDLESNDPANGLGTIGTKLDAEFAAVLLTLSETLTNLALIQRDDGELANRTVGASQLKTGTAVGVEPASAWVTATEYETNDLVWQNSKLYLAEEDHTAGTFATDLAASKWTEIINLTDEVPAATGLYINDVEEKTTDYTVVAADNGKAFLADTSGGDVTFTLPEISGLSNGDFFRVTLFKKTAGNNMIADGAGSDTVNGSATESLSDQYSAITLFSRTGDTDWKVLDHSPAATANSSNTVARNITFFEMTGA